MTPNDVWLAMPPFPPLVWDGFFWRGVDKLPAWAGFQSRRGPYATRDRRAASRSDVEVSVKVEVRGDGTPALPDEAQRRAYGYLKEHDARIAAAIHKRLLRVYPRERREAIDADDELGDLLPVIKDVGGLRRVVGLGTVHVLSVAAKRHAYVGFELGCEWEEEHGFGVMTHRARIVDHGHADHAFLEWIAERDRDGKPRDGAT